MRAWIVGVPEWWLTALCCAVEVYSRHPIEWSVAQDIGYRMTASMVARGRS